MPHRRPLSIPLPAGRLEQGALGATCRELDRVGALDDEALRQKLALALPADVVARLAAMVAGTVEVTVTTGGVAQGDALNTAMFAGVDEVRQAAYNAARQEQALTWRGVLFDVDGTLTDTNHLHTLAWRRAFLELGTTWRRGASTA